MNDVTLTHGEHMDLGRALNETDRTKEFAHVRKAVESIVATREQALREEIAGEIEAEAYPFRALSDPDGYRATMQAARIARGGTQ